MKEKNIGTSSDSWLDEEGIRQEVTANAIKRVLARQVHPDSLQKPCLIHQYLLPVWKR